MVRVKWNLAPNAALSGYKKWGAAQKSCVSTSSSRCVAFKKKLYIFLNLTQIYKLVKLNCSLLNLFSDDRSQTIPPAEGKSHITESEFTAKTRGWTSRRTLVPTTGIIQCHFVQTVKWPCGLATPKGRPLLQGCQPITKKVKKQQKKKTTKKLATSACFIVLVSFIMNPFWKVLSLCVVHPLPNDRPFSLQTIPLILCP